MQLPVETPYNAKTTAQEVASHYDLTGKIMIVTGANTGLGKETARVLGGSGATVILTVRDKQVGLQVAQELSTSTGKDNFIVEELDLSSKPSIRAFAARINERYTQLDVLISNAGIMGVPKKLIDGLESQMAVNYLGHMLLSALLSPLLKKTQNARVITLTSIAHQISDINFDDFNCEKKDYIPMVAYGRSKTASSLLSIALHTRLQKYGVTCLAVHPGVIHETGLTRSMDEKGIAQIAAVAEGTDKTIASGAATSVWAALSEELQDKGGLYLEDCKVAELVEKPNFVSGVLPHALSVEIADQLWAQAEQWLGERLDIE
ncbi:3-beta-hydroxycholanate 3-dehydrogenase (NADP(+)) [Zhongshania aliphaticivorans]|uniref:3-beta-hydroxycholanate 3-dehydrogenase (NADP(+)) n=1 Tax=Zhongshania aliphaticivorans TaxID=1470434 RepID=A0A5S9NRK6_9GAMM|nr:SDR family NAD(P)-dependent oxidoreductase [Zhongshania aliphaticivorans]CAA0093136.1 3-beta-hydroxycholanate 3-dehydrogenase (NADP(+)) [Zhongshania aliphaticivorans]CAA0110919.1 3-beta-hydroxycholanate 3-dehydrogenase (NADP(+)) [Zhongshania aliphaticivorans]